MATKLIRVPAKTYDGLKAVSMQRQTTMSSLLQQAVIDMASEDLANVKPPSDSDLVTLLATILESRGKGK